MQYYLPNQRIKADMVALFIHYRPPHRHHSPLALFGFDNPGQAGLFQVVFGMIMTVLIALDFNHLIRSVLECRPNSGACPKQELETDQVPLFGSERGPEAFAHGGLFFFVGGPRRS
jgi:hypothetical protein